MRGIWQSAIGLKLRMLLEVYIDSGPVKYCIIYEVTEDYVGLISLWHGVGSRKSDILVRLWGMSR